MRETALLLLLDLCDMLYQQQVLWECIFATIPNHRVPVDTIPALQLKNRRVETRKVLLEGRKGKTRIHIKYLYSHTGYFIDFRERHEITSRQLG